MPSDPVILLDTSIVAGCFAVSKTGDHVAEQKKLLQSAVMKLASSVSSKCLIRVPTPVCYELMAMNAEWYKFISKSKNTTFRFATSSIPNDILLLAAQYSYSVSCNYFDGEKQKIKTMDPLIAAYSIKGSHYLLTTNQHDFPESHFYVVGTEVLVLSGKNGKYRNIIYLLKPNEPATGN